MKNKKKRTKKMIAVIVCSCFVGCLLSAGLGLQIAFNAADEIKVWRPDYEAVDLSELLEKEELSDEDYRTLYAQTGLTKIGIDRARAKTGGKQLICEIQENYFMEYQIINSRFAPFICTDRIDGEAQAVYLENGDVVVTSSTHLSGYRMGHAGLVTDGENGYVIQAMAYGEPTYVGKISDFTSRVNFMIFAPKCDEETKQAVAEYAETLVGTEYSALTGIFTDKYSANKTQCAHLVWYAYMQFGIDLDSDGGGLVTPHDLARSPQLELVQVFGFDPVTLW